METQDSLHSSSLEVNNVASSSKLDESDVKEVRQYQLTEIQLSQSTNKFIETADEQVAGSAQRLNLPREGNTSQVGLQNGSSETQTSNNKASKTSQNKKSGLPVKTSGFQKPPKNIFKPTVQVSYMYVDYHL